MHEPKIPEDEADEPPQSDAQESPTEVGRGRVKEKDTKRRLSIIHLDNLIDIASHPGSILIIAALMVIVFLVTRYVGNCRQNEILLMISYDFYRWLTYAGAIIITYITTRFLENRKRNKKD